MWFAIFHLSLIFILVRNAKDIQYGIKILTHKIQVNNSLIYNGIASVANFAFIVATIILFVSAIQVLHVLV